MRIRILLALCLSAGISHAGNYADPSFDCATADERAERIICSFEDLCILDQRLHRLITTGPEQPLLQAQQRRWIRDVRNQCTDVLCLRAVYAERIDEVLETKWQAREAARLAEKRRSEPRQEARLPVEAPPPKTAGPVDPPAAPSAKTETPAAATEIRFEDVVLWISPVLLILLFLAARKALLKANEEYANSAPRFERRAMLEPGLDSGGDPPTQDSLRNSSAGQDTPPTH